MNQSGSHRKEQLPDKICVTTATEYDEERQPSVKERRARADRIYGRRFGPHLRIGLC